MSPKRVTYKCHLLITVSAKSVTQIEVSAKAMGDRIQLVRRETCGPRRLGSLALQRNGEQNKDRRA